VVVSGPVVVVVSGSVVSPSVVVVVEVEVEVVGELGSTGAVVLVLVLVLSLSPPLPSGPAVVGVLVGPLPVVVVDGSSALSVVAALGGPTLSRPLASKLQPTRRAKVVQRARATR